MNRSGLVVLVFAALLAPLPAIAAPAFLSSGQAVPGAPFPDDAYVAGGNVTISYPVQGDLKVAGGNITINAPVTGSLYAAGGNITINAPVGNDLFALGATVQLRARVGDDAFISAGNLDAASVASVGGSAFVATGNALWMARVEGDLSVQSGSLTYGGMVRGQGDFRSEGVVTILPGAAIDGDLRFVANHNPAFDPGFVGGTFRHDRVGEGGTASVASAFDWRSLPLLVSFSNLAGSLILGALLLVLFPNLAFHTAERATSAPLSSLWYGFLVVTVASMAALVAFVSFIGLKLAIVLLAYLSTLTTLAGTLGGYLVAHWIMRRQRASHWRTAAAFAIGTLLYAAVSVLPYIGTPVWAVLSLVSIGALYHVENEAYRALRSQGLV